MRQYFYGAVQTFWTLETQRFALCAFARKASVFLAIAIPLINRHFLYNEKLMFSSILGEAAGKIT